MNQGTCGPFISKYDTSLTRILKQGTEVLLGLGKRTGQEPTRLLKWVNFQLHDDLISGNTYKSGLSQHYAKGKRALAEGQLVDDQYQSQSFYINISVIDFQGSPTMNPFAALVQEHLGHLQTSLEVKNLGPLNFPIILACQKQWRYSSRTEYSSSGDISMLSYWESGRSLHYKMEV